MSVMTVPFIDIAQFSSGGIDQRRAIAKAVNQACEEIGFFVITGHVIEAQLCERIFEVSREFYDLPVGEKLKVKQSAGVARGYSPLCGEAFAYSRLKKTPGDLKESFSIGPIGVPADEYHTCVPAQSHFAENLWPVRPREFRAIWSEYFQRMESLADMMMRIFALALQLPEDYFEDKIDRHVSALRVHNYPNQPEPPQSGQLRAGEHSDLGTFTILRHEREHRPGGLQVHTRSGAWIDVPAIPDSFVINLGDMMMRWTNDRWLSTPHRVVNPPRERALESRRMAAAFFHETNYDTLVECLPTCSSTANPPKYSPISCGEYLYERIMRFQRGWRDQGAA